MTASKLPHARYLEEEHTALIAEVESFARAEIDPLAEESADYTAQARELLRRLAGADMLRHVVPQAYGGHQPQLDIRSLCLVRRILARHSALADTMFAMQGLGSYPITLAGSEEVKRRFLPQVKAGKAVAAFGLTEEHAGSDAAGIRTTAQREGAEYVLNGSKRFISNAGIADFYVVFAKTDPSQGRKGISAIVVEKDRPGFRVERQIELIAPHPIGELKFEDCRVPADNLLGKEGQGYSIMLQTLECFRTTVGAAALGMAERALEEASAYTRKRVQFGKAISEFEGIQFMLADMATELEAARLLVLTAAWKLDLARREGPSDVPITDRTLVMASSMAKLYATEMAQRVIDRALQLHGGMGVVKGVVVERLYREIRSLRVYEGTSEIQRQIIGHQLLKR